MKSTLFLAAALACGFVPTPIAGWVNIEYGQPVADALNTPWTKNEVCRSVTFPLNKQLQPVTDVFEEIKRWDKKNPNEEIGRIQVMATHEHARGPDVYKFLGTPYNKLEEYCTKILNDRLYPECVKGATPESVSKIQPCTQRSFVVNVTCGFVDYNSKHVMAPGTIGVGTDRYLKPLQWVRSFKTNYPDSRRTHPNIHYYDHLASAIQAYPFSKGHHLHEVLPRIIWLNSILPPEVKILSAQNPFTHRYVELLERTGVLKPDRLVKWGGMHVFSSWNHVYQANHLYWASEWPACNDGNPHNGGTSTYYPKEMLIPVHKAFVPEDIPLTERNVILVIQRKRDARRLTNHLQLLFALEQEFPTHQVRVFDASGPLSTHIDQFRKARVVIAPHGAGLANVVFCSPGTTVIELGFDSTKYMDMDNMYFKVANGLELDYWMIMAHGDYKSPMTVDISEVIDLLLHGGQRYYKNKRVPISATLSTKKPASHNKDLTYTEWYTNWEVLEGKRKTEMRANNDALAITNAALDAKLHPAASTVAFSTSDASADGDGDNNEGENESSEEESSDGDE